MLSTSTSQEYCGVALQANYELVLKPSVGGVISSSFTSTFKNIMLWFCQFVIMNYVKIITEKGYAIFLVVSTTNIAYYPISVISITINNAYYSTASADCLHAITTRVSRQVATYKSRISV